MNKKETKEWYDNPNIISNFLIGLLILILIISQAFAARNQLGMDYLFRSLVNYNSFYLVFLAYFILLKTKVGKRYFNVMNLVLILLEFLVLFGSILNMIQFFHLSTLFTFLSNIILFIYMSYTLFQETRIWDYLHLDALQLQVIKNEQYFYVFATVSILILVVELVNSIEFNHVVLKLLECIFSIAFARYLYLYQDYREKKKLGPSKEEEEELNATRELKELKEEIIASAKKEDKKNGGKKNA